MTPLARLAMCGLFAFALSGLGVFLGRVGRTSWLWSGVKTLLIALATVGLVLLLGDLT